MAKAKKPNYFKLPFEAHFPDTNVYCYEFYAECFDPKKFKDIKAVSIKHGTSYSPVFLCEKNTGKELKACIDENFGQFLPSWLTFQGDDDQDIGYEKIYRVQILNGEVSFVEDDELDISDLNPTGIVLEVFESTYIEHLIVDFYGSCLKVSSTGTPEEDDSPDDEEAESVFDDAILERLKKGPAAREFTNWELVSEWIDKVFAKEFPGQKKLKFSKESPI